VNRAHASTQGAELAAERRLSNHVHTRVTYTYLSAYDDDTHLRLNRRPRHAADAEIHGDIVPGIVAGVGVHLVADNVNGMTPFGGYTTVRAFAGWQVRRELTLKLRIENALDRKYEEVYGYPALPMRVFGGVEWSW
jgi:vitamin B12 transporter